MNISFLVTFRFRWDLVPISSSVSYVVVVIVVVVVLVYNFGIFHSLHSSDFETEFARMVRLSIFTQFFSSSQPI